MDKIVTSDFWIWWDEKSKIDISGGHEEWEELELSGLPEEVGRAFYYDVSYEQILLSFLLVLELEAKRRARP